MQAFAWPLPVAVICDLLGAPDTIARQLRWLRVSVLDPAVSAEAAQAAGAETASLIAGLVAHKRQEPGDDLLSTLMAEEDLTDEELSGIAMLLLIAGHETTAAMFSLIGYLLLTDEDARKSFTAEPLTDAGADELLRYLSSVQYVSRAALSDAAIEGRLIPEGSTVTVSLSAVNRDPKRFPEPDTVDPTRSGPSHLAFGHGLHQCIGQNLARAEIRIGVTALFRRFPRLRLAEHDAPVTGSEQRNTYSLERLPVLW